jgi:hypothetical protein
LRKKNQRYNGHRGQGSRANLQFSNIRLLFWHLTGGREFAVVALALFIKKGFGTFSNIVSIDDFLNHAA